MKLSNLSAPLLLAALSALFWGTGTHAQQPTRGAFEMPFAHDPNRPDLPPPTDPSAQNQLSKPASVNPQNIPVNSAGLPAGQKPDKVQQQAQAIIASDRGTPSDPEETQIWNDPNSDDTPPGDNPNNPLFTFP